MRAIVLDQPGSFRVASVPDPAPGPGEVVVKVDYCGICGTDLHILAGEFPPTPANSCPGVIGYGVGGNSPSRMCRSVPQIPQ
jgi:D-arabinose 1-dehydrogenase-like Zn-dependent alcohol dehydrogenase